MKSKELLIFGLGQHYQNTNAGIPEQWERFVTYPRQIDGQIGHVTYCVIYNSDNAGHFDYIRGGV